MSNQTHVSVGHRSLKSCQPDDEFVVGSCYFTAVASYFLNPQGASSGTGGTRCEVSGLHGQTPKGLVFRGYYRGLHR